MLSLILQEANKYIANIRKKFGRFGLVTDRIAIDPMKYDEYMAEAFPDLAEYHRSKADSFSASAENLPEAEYLDDDVIGPPDTDGDINDCMGNRSSDDDDAMSEATSDKLSNHTNLQPVIKLQRTNQTCVTIEIQPCDDGKLSKHSGCVEILNDQNGTGDTSSHSSHSYHDENEHGALDSDSDDVQMIPMEEVTENANQNAHGTDTEVKAIRHKRRSMEVTQSEPKEMSENATENEQPVGKRARLMENDHTQEPNARTAANAAEQPANIVNAEDAGDAIETILSAPPLPQLPPPEVPPLPPLPPQPLAPLPPKCDSKPAHSDATAVSAQLMGWMRNVNEKLYDVMLAKFTAVHNENDQFKRQIDDRDCQLSLTRDQLKQANDKIIDLEQQLDAKGACDMCGKGINGVYYCSNDCRTLHLYVINLMYLCNSEYWIQ